MIIRAISTLWNFLTSATNTIGDLEFSSAYPNLKAPRYFEIDLDFPESQKAFFYTSRCIPLSFRRDFSLPGTRGYSLHPGLGTAYFKNSVNQVVRKSPPIDRLTFGPDIFPKENQALVQQMTSRFVDDPNYRSNFYLYAYFSFGIQKKIKKGNKLEFDLSYMPNFRDPHYKHYIEFTLETSIYDISDPDNHVLVETTDKGTTQFELRQGGITFSLRYYPKAFQTNASK